MSAFSVCRGGIPYHFKIVFCCCMLMVVGLAIPLTCASLFFPQVSAYLGVGSGQVSFILTIQCFVLALLLPLAGRIMATRDIRHVLSCAVLLYGLGMGLMAFYTRLWQFYLSGVIMGVGGAFVIYLCIPFLIQNWFCKRVGLAMGVSYAFAGIGATLFSPATGFVIDHFGWRPAYLFLAASILVLGLPCTLFIVRARPSDMGLEPYGAENAQHTARTDTVRGVRKAVALRSPQFAQLVVFAGFLGLAAGMLYQMSNYVVSLGYSTGVAANIVAFGTVGVTCGKVGVGYLNDRIGLEKAATIGIGTGFFGTLMLLMGPAWGLPALFIGCALLGVSYSCTALEPPLVVRQVFGSRDYTDIFSIIMVFSSMGTAFGTSGLGFVKDVTGSFAASLVLVAVLLVVALALGLLALRTAHRLPREHDELASPNTGEPVPPLART